MSSRRTEDPESKTRDPQGKLVHLVCLLILILQLRILAALDWCGVVERRLIEHSVVFMPDVSYGDVVYQTANEASCHQLSLGCGNVPSTHRALAAQLVGAVRGSGITINTTNPLCEWGVYLIGPPGRDTPGGPKMVTRFA